LVSSWSLQEHLKISSTSLPLHCSLITTPITAVRRNNSVMKSDVIKQWHSRFLYPTREPKENTQPHYIQCVPLPNCTVATTVTAMCQCYGAGIVCDSINTRKDLRPATSAQVFLGFPVSISKCSDGSQHSKLPLHASHVALQT
jgi:hypothetical protein